MKEEIYIRKADKKDMTKVADIISSSAEWYRPFVAEKDMSEHTPDQKWIEKNYARREFFIGANSEGQEVGTISMQYFGDKTYLGYIYLDTDHVGNGYGRKLMTFAERRSKAKDQEAMILIAHPKAKWATKAYEKFGFEKVAEKKDDILSYHDGILKTYYEEGFHLYQYDLTS